MSRWEHRISTTSPLSELALGKAEDRCWVHVTSDDERGVIGDVILALDRTHLFRCGRRYDLPVTDYIFPAEIARVELRIHLACQREEWTGFVAIVLADYDLAFTLKLVPPKERPAQRGCQQVEAITEFLRWYRHVVVDPLFLGRAVEHRAEIRRLVPELIRLGILRIGAEKHMLVHVRQPLVLRALCKRAVLYVDLNRR